jgi:hypothetical protein
VPPALSARADKVIEYTLQPANVICCGALVRKWHIAAESLSGGLSGAGETDACA